MRFARVAASVSLAVALAAAADVAPESVGEVARLPERWPARAFWASDLLLRRAALFDADSGAMLGSLYGGQDLSPVLPLASHARREVYVAETHYARRTHGERTDVLSIYDASTLAPAAEVVLPPKKASNGNGVALGALLDDGRFALVFNQNPASSVSVVDVAERRLVGEIETAGCGLVYAAGPRRFGMLCADGTALAIALDESGAEASRAASEKFFDAANAPVTEKGVRLGDGRWLFVSFDGRAHEVDFAVPRAPAVKPAWSLLTDAERGASWRIGGHQHLAYHAASGTLYSLMHTGGPDTHKQAGTELWVYDVAKRAKTRTIEVPNLDAAGLRGLLALEKGGWVDWLLGWFVPNGGAESVLVTPDGERLVLARAGAPVLEVLDAQSGAVVREIGEPGLAVGLLGTP